MTTAARRHLRLITSNRGFTLVELIVVLMIIAVLLTVVLTTNLAAKRRAADRAAQALVYQILPSIEAYAADNAGYVGVTAVRLRDTYDRGIDAAAFRFGGVAESTYCVQATTSGSTWRKNGPGQPIEAGSCA